MLIRYKNIRLNTRATVGVLIFSACALLSYLFVNLAYDVPFYEALGWMWAVAILVIMCAQVTKIEADWQIKRLLYLHILISLVLIVYNTLRASEGDFMSDEAAFLPGSTGYFRASFTGEDYFNPYYNANSLYMDSLIGLFSFFGINSACIRMIFLYFWFLGYRLIEKMAYDITSREYVILSAFYSLMPWEIFVNSQILREPIICLFLMLSMFFLWKWMKTGVFQYIIIAFVLPIVSAAMHPGNLAMFAVVGVTYCFWDFKRQRWQILHFSWKKYLVVAILIAIPFMFEILQVLGYEKLIGIGGSITDILQSRQDNLIHNVGASTYYMREFDLSSPLGAIAMILYRSLYFWISPSPMFWKTPGHVISFLMDSCVWIAYFVYMIRNVCIRRTNRMGGVFIPVVFFFTVLYGLGTNTGGTAMRHRGQLLGILVMCAVLNNRKKLLAIHDELDIANDIEYKS